MELLVTALEWPETETGDAPVPVLHRFRWEGRPSPEARDLTARFSFPLSTGRYRIVHTVRDAHRGADVTGTVLLDGWAPEAPVRCLAFDPETGDPAWDHALPAQGRMGLLVPADLSTGLWSHSQLAPVDSFPSAPFLDRTVAALAFPDPEARQLPLTPADADGLLLPEGDWSGWKVLLWEGEPDCTNGGHQKAIAPSSWRPDAPISPKCGTWMR